MEIGLEASFGHAAGAIRKAFAQAVRHTLPAGIALLLAGCPAATTSASLSETSNSSSPSASPQSTADLPRSEKPSASTGGNGQTTALSATATKSGTEETWAVQQAILNDPLLNAAIHQEFERVSGRDPADVHPLQVGAIAIVENYRAAHGRNTRTALGCK